MKRHLFSRGINKIYSSIVRRIKQRSISDGCKTLKYLYFKNLKNKYLIVCFPAFADEGAKYNYVYTLNKVRANKLFFLDDFAENGRGCYLLGGVETLVKSVINKAIDETSPDKIIFVGSSKGAYSALYYSFFFPNVYVCIAAPQYLLGNYLNCDVMMPNLKAIIGDSVDDMMIENLNMKLKNTMASSENKPRKVFLHYSDKEHTYAEHIVYLIKDMRKYGISYESNIEHYEKHKDLVLYFPSYLKSTLFEIMQLCDI